jgi:hypothetical protein
MILNKQNAVLDLGGWEYQPERFERIVGEAGKSRFWVGHPEATGAHKGKIVLQHKAFDAVLGKQPSYKAQTRGTCVGRGGGRVITLSQAVQHVAGQGKYRAEGLSAGVYGGARVEFGGGRLRGDGAVVAYAVECMTSLGCLLAEQYEAEGRVVDLRGRHDDDDLAVQWGRSGIPDALEPIASRHKLLDWCPVEAMDAIASGWQLIFGTSLAHWGRNLPATRDAEGFLRLTGTTAHCWIGTGTVDDGRRPGIVLDNKSWGDGWCNGPEGKYPLGAGRYLADPDDLTRMIRSGEGYAVRTLDGLEPMQKFLDWVTL